MALIGLVYAVYDKYGNNAAKLPRGGRYSMTGAAVACWEDLSRDDECKCVGTCSGQSVCVELNSPQLEMCAYQS